MRRVQCRSCRVSSGVTESQRHPATAVCRSDARSSYGRANELRACTGCTEERQRGPAPSSLARALAEPGRVIKTLHVLGYVHDPAYRRTIHHMLSRGERRNSLARAVFHGQRGQLRRHYQVGQENQLDSLGIMINVIVLWQTVNIQAALDHLAAKGYPIDPADVARLTPLGHPTVNLDGRYRTTNRPPATGLRPLRIN